MKGKRITNRTRTRLLLLTQFYNWVGLVFSDGYGDSKKWINGKVVLIEKDDLLWIKEFERPWNGAVSDNGRIALVHTINQGYSRLSSSQKKSVDLVSKLTVIESSGEEISTHNFGSTSTRGGSRTYSSMGFKTWSWN